MLPQNVTIHRCENLNSVIAVECEIPTYIINSGISDFFLCSKHQKPDLYTHLDDDLTAEMIMDIHSSPYKDTLRKALITAIDLLHLGRMYSNTK